jgi:hypothetical protein
MAFDSCFSGAIFQMARTKPSAYIEEKVAYPVRQFMTAGSEDETVPDKSIFKDVFIQAIQDGFADLNQDAYITGEELGGYLQEHVVNYTHKAQHPQFGKINNPKLDKDDFVFLRTGGGAVNLENNQLPWAACLPMPGDFTTCTAMFMNGVRTGTGIIQSAR